MEADAADRDDRLDQVMTEFLAALGRRERPAPAAYAEAHPDLAVELVPLLENVVLLHDKGQQLGADAAEAGATPLLEPRGQLGDFEILRVLGRGGMGVVYEALQVSLARRVALKVLPVGAAIDQRARRRFLREAQIAAFLRHAHIVPVFAVGETDGVQYFAMQLIDGQSLDAVLQVLRARAGLAPGVPDSPSDAGLLATGLAVGFPTPGSARAAGHTGSFASFVPHSRDYLERVVRIVAAAAEALDCAHEAEVTHRDVKPGNLILDMHGKVWLTDFGLARVREGGDTTTRWIGTLRYMSPEQASGRPTAVDRRADVYALGLTLYELLTLRPAFAAATEVELLFLIQTAEPPAVRSLNPAVPGDLETVVQKATAKEPGDRYPTARAFAEDLGRLLAGLPVRARRLTRWQRGWRWVRRHRRQLSVAGGAAVAGLFLGLGVSTYLVWTAYRDADTRRARLAAREGELLALVEQVNQSELVLKEVPGAQAEQRALLRRVKEVLCRQADEPGAPERARWDAYRACRRLVDAESRFGNQPAAGEAAREARDRLAALVRDAPNARASRLELARCARDLGGVFMAAGDDEASLNQYQTALALYEGLEAEEPDDTDALNDLGHVRLSIAELWSMRGQMAEAVAIGHRGLEVDEGLARRFPDGHPQSYIRLVISHLKLSWLCCRAGDASRAEEHFRKAVASEGELSRRFERFDDLRLYTVASRGRLGMFLAGRARFKEARRELETCVADAERLGKRFPGDVAYRVQVAECRRELGRIAYLEGQDEEARRQYALMVDAFRALSAAGASHDPWGEYLAVPLAGVVDLRDPAGAPSDRIRSDPSLGGRYNGALLHLRRGELAAAEALFKPLTSAPAMNSHRQMAGYYLARCLAGRGASAAAWEAFDTSETYAKQVVTPDASALVARREALLALPPR